MPLAATWINRKGRKERKGRIRRIANSEEVVFAFFASFAVQRPCCPGHGLPACGGGGFPPCVFGFSGSLFAIPDVAFSRQVFHTAHGDASMSNFVKFRSESINRRQIPTKTIKKRPVLPYPV
jgi:hypothetical protein